MRRKIKTSIRVEIDDMEKNHELLFTKIFIHIYFPWERIRQIIEQKKFFVDSFKI